MAKTRKNASQLHIKTLNAIKEIFPGAVIIQEYAIKPLNSKTLYLDIYLPMLRYAFEVQGQQHFEYNSFHYKSPYEFKNQQRRDDLKEIYCQENNIILIKINYNEEINAELIRQKIRELE